MRGPGLLRPPPPPPPAASPAQLTSPSRRPFQRTVTLHRDSAGHVGFVIKKGKVVSVVKGSSAARNGLLTNHYVCEVNGQNVIGLKVGQRGLCLELQGREAAGWGGVGLPP